jgi:hypothetical protein
MSEMADVPNQPGRAMARSKGNEVVLRFRDGNLSRCVLTREFTPLDFAVEARTVVGESLRVNISELKAVFFLKDPRRREAEMQLGTATDDVPAGAPARVEFFDGEIVHGVVQEYRMEDSGFFLYPTSSESNNELVFVVARAINTLSLEG